MEASGTEGNEAKNSGINNTIFKSIIETKKKNIYETNPENKGNKNIIINKENQDEEYVQVHDIDTCGGDTPVGFCGVFKWKNNELISLDNDSYWKDMLVYAYSYWEHDGVKGLDILVEDW